MNTKTAGHKAPLRKPAGVNQDYNTAWMQKKATGLLQKAGLQLPSVLLLTDGYIRSVRDSDSSVKQFENATKRL